MKTSFFWILALLCLIIKPSIAQESTKKRPERERHFTFGFGIIETNIKDEIMSPVRYSGGSLALNFGLRKQTDNWLSRIDISLSGGSLRSLYYEETERGKTLNFRLDIAYSRLQKLKKWSSPSKEWFVGGHLSTFSGLRLHNQLDNSSGIYDSFTSLGLSGAFRKSFELKKRKFQFYYQANIPLVSLVMRPSFNGVFNFIDPELDFFQENFDIHGWASFGSYFRLNNRFELAYTTKGGHNQLMLGYQWDVYHYNKVHRMLAGRHQVSLSTLFYF